jgi:hypothetical protein
LPIGLRNEAVGLSRQPLKAFARVGWTFADLFVNESIQKKIALARPALFIVADHSDRGMPQI